MSVRVVLSVFACVPGCSSTMDFDCDVEYSNLTYGNYANKIGTHYVDPVGGSDICVRLFCTKDTSDYWLKVSMSPSNFNALLQSHRWYNRLPEISKVGIPADWPTPYASIPDWWQLPRQTASTKIMVCENRDEEKPGGEYWQYDEVSQTLWVFDWYHQWAK